MTEQTRRTLCSSFRKILFILIGCFLYAAGIGLFLDPNKLAPGGVVGISVILSHSLGGETGTWYFLWLVEVWGKIHYQQLLCDRIEFHIYEYIQYLSGGDE